VAVPQATVLAVAVAQLLLAQTERMIQVVLVAQECRRQLQRAQSLVLAVAAAVGAVLLVLAA